MTYLDDVQATTPTRFWVNNPTRADSASAIDAGAVGVTTNPAFVAKLLQTEREHIAKIITDVVATEPDNSAAAERVYHLASQVLMQQWLPVYESSGGQRGFVTIQEDPRREEDRDYILAASLRAQELSPNYMAKVPVTEPGLAVIRELVAHGIPICATEVFSIAQYRALMDAYADASRASGKSPVLLVTHITGISDEYFASIAASERLGLPADLLAKAGTAIGMREYALSQKSEVPHRILGGGARTMSHFTNFVGSDLDITINWSTANELNASLSSADETSYEPATDEDVRRLRADLPNFARGYDDHGLSPEEFADYGPVMAFRTQFLNGYSRLLDAVAEARRA